MALRSVLPLLVILPHTAVFVYAGLSKYRRWRQLDPATRPRFVDFLSREGTPPPSIDRAKWEIRRRRQ
jgi:hypothetical protein